MRVIDNFYEQQYIVDKKAIVEFNLCVNHRVYYGNFIEFGIRTKVIALEHTESTIIKKINDEE